MTNIKNRSSFPEQSVLDAWRSLELSNPQIVSIGHINRTYFYQSTQGKMVLQRLHPVFSAELHQDIKAVTEHLVRKNMLTSKLIPTDLGHLYLEKDGIWRLMTFVEGVCFEKIQNAEHAYSAGALVAKFHSNLDDLEHSYKFSRGNVHDTKKHVKTLKNALITYKGHRLFDQVSEAAQKVIASLEKLPIMPNLQLRNSHGDLKLSNLLFTEEYKGVCLVDLDTLSLMSWPFEMGDALRSWCNLHAEGAEKAEFSLEYFKAALEGYSQKSKLNLSRAELIFLVPSIQIISLELSCRFLADALQESYFAFDNQKYIKSGEHQLQRGRSMYLLAEDLQKKSEDLNFIIKNTFNTVY